MLEHINQAKELCIQFGYEKIGRMAGLYDVAEALSIERDKLEQMGLPTQVHDDLLVKIESEFRAEAAKYSTVTVSQPVGNSS